jgi:cytochrome d ubiquinol oxidase subunit I
VVAAFFVMGISAWHILRNNELKFFKLSFRTAAVFGIAACLLVIITGDFHGVNVAKTQPAKLAAIEAIWETQKGAGLSLITIPDDANRRNAVEMLTIPKMASLLSYRDPNAVIRGLNDFPKDEIPPVSVTFYSYRLMAVLGIIMFGIAAAAAYISRKENLETYRGLLKISLWSIPLPYLAGQLGWIVAEVGRQPWIVYGMLKTRDAVSKSVDVTQVLISLICFTLLYGSLGAVDIYLLSKYAKQGPTELLVKKEA